MHAIAELGYMSFLEGQGFPSAIITDKGYMCGFCGEIAFNFINRWGRSRCLECDHKQFGADA